ncbi:MAG: REP-associated tyrosine transposase [Pyrinomonadaceae bacterium]
MPHFDGGEIAQAITFRLGDSLPQTVLAAWREELSRENAAKIDAALRRRIESYLDQGYGSSWLKDARVASMIQEALLHFDGSRYKLSAWVVMPNHLHLILTPHVEYQLSKILHSLKSYTAHEANRILRREGKLWQDDYFDRYIRDPEHFAAAVAYVESNPVKAGLCRRVDDWPYSSARLRKL